MGEDDVLIIQFHPEHGIRQQLSDHATELDHIFFRQKNLLGCGAPPVKWAETRLASSFVPARLILPQKCNRLNLRL
jgi:hypothetical protein